MQRDRKEREEMKTLNTEQLSKLLESGFSALFDVRGDIEYEKNHIPGAKSAPLGSLTFRVASVMNPDSQIVVYSDGPENGIAAEAVQRLENLRMRNVYLYEDGLDGWLASGHSSVESPSARIHTRGPVKDVRPLVVDRENSYGGAFKGEPSAVEGAGG
jgi:rhodanese-related sulfurtransferase